MATPTPKEFLVDVSLIDVGEQMIRETPDDDSIGELAQSIAKNGLLQAIGVSRTEDGRYQLRWGHRRLLAHQRAGMRQIRAVEYRGEEESIKALALIENLHRANMTLTEEVNVCKFLTEHEEKSVDQITSILSKSRSWVLNRLMVPHLPDHLREPLLDGALPMSHVEIIAKVPDLGAQQYLVNQCIFQRWNKSQLKTIADCYLVPPEEAKPPAPGTPGINPNGLTQVFLYPCQMCGEKARLEQTTLVRIHADGYGCRAEGDRPDHESRSVDALGSDPGHDPGRQDGIDNREGETSPGLERK